jgi:hypothetical protein
MTYYRQILSIIWPNYVFLQPIILKSNKIAILLNSNKSITVDENISCEFFETIK